IGRMFAWTLVQPIGAPKVKVGLEKAYAPAPTPEEYHARAKLMWTRPSEAIATAQDNLERRAYVDQVAEQYPRIEARTLIIVGGKDALTPPDQHGRKLASAIPGAKLISLPNDGHMVPQADPRAVIDAVRALETNTASAEAL